MSVRDRRRTRAVACEWLVGLTLCLVASGVHAEEGQSPPEQPRKFEVALGAWLSAGETRWAHNASGSSPIFGNPTSKLIYKDHNTNIAELTLKAPLGSRLFGRLNLGFAGGGSGTLTDNDYLAVDGGNPSSSTQSSLSNDTTVYLNADLGTRVSTFANQRGWIDAFAGFQYWHQQYKAYGVNQTICTTAGSTNPPPPDNLCTPGAAPVSNSVLVITNTTNWYSIRAGGQVEYQLTKHVGLQGSVVLIPLSIVENNDTHHLRTDLQQNPSFSMIGLGLGADLEAGVKIMIIRNLFFNVGYRFWWNQTYTGTLTTHPIGSPTGSFPLTQFQSYRYGTTFGLSYTF